MTTVYVTGRAGKNLVVNVDRNGKVLHYGAVVTAEKLRDYQTSPDHEVVICDSTIRL